MSPSVLAQLEDQFLEYQVMSDSEISSSVWESAEDEEGHLRMDMNNMKSPDGSSCFQNLVQVAILEAAEECVYSLVNKNKTKLRPTCSLQLDGTLSSILTIKLPAGDIPCYELKPPSSVFRDC